MKTNITLKLDAELLREARVLAAEEDTSISAMLAAKLEQIVTDDNCWTLHFLPQGEGWQVILTLSAEAPYAARLLREQPLLRVVDGGGAIVLQGRLDADGECERAWPFETAPAPHFQMYGASFSVEPVVP